MEALGNFLVDLGDIWGQVVSLNVLENIAHIEVIEEKPPSGRFFGLLPSNEPTRKRLQFTTILGEEENRKELVYVSKGHFTEEEIAIEKGRLLCFSNGIVSNEEIFNIVNSMEKHTGSEIKLDELNEATNNLAFLKKKRADANGTPYFRMQIAYNPHTNDVVLDEDYNKAFFDASFTPEMKQMSKNLSNEDRAILYAYEILRELVAGIYPEEENSDAGDAGEAMIPALGSTGLTTHTLSNDDSGARTVVSSASNVSIRKG